MKVVFRKSLENVAEIGDVKAVKPGYARNFLIPQELAVPATPHELSQLEAQISKLKQQEAKEESVATAKQKELEKLHLEFEREAGDDGTLFGTVTKQDIAEELERLLKSDIDRHQLEFEIPHSLGDYEATYRISPSVHAKVKLTVRRKASGGDQQS